MNTMEYEFISNAFLNPKEIQDGVNEMAQRGWIFVGIFSGLIVMSRPAQNTTMYGIDKILKRLHGLYNTILDPDSGWQLGWNSAVTMAIKVVGDGYTQQYLGAEVEDELPHISVTLDPVVVQKIKNGNKD